MVSAIQFLHQKVVGLVGDFLLSLFTLFRFITSYLFRYTKNGGLVDFSEENNQNESNCIEPKIENAVKKYIPEVTDSENYDDKEETREFSFKFKFPTFEEFIRHKDENGDFSIPALVHPTKNVNQCETSVGMSYGGFDKEQEFISSGVNVNVNVNVNEFTADKKADSVEEKVSILDGFLSDMDFNPDDDAKKHEAMKFRNNFRVDDESISEGLTYSEKDSLFTNSDSESTTLDHVRSVMSRLMDSHSDGFLSDGDFGGELEFDSLITVPEKGMEFHGEMSESDEDWETVEFEEGNSDILEELDQLEGDHLNSEFLSEKDFHGDKDDNPMNGPDISEENTSENVVVSESGDANKLETLWEHQELIEQLKMELRKVKATGLPTILEESESPKMMEDLKPWKIDEKFHREDCMGELHKIYKSYKERMRKFDILNYQKMYAIGFLQLKDPLQSITTSQKSSGPTLKSLVRQNFKLLKNKSHDSEPMTKFIKELQSDLEVVYVGQMCLSWEFLHWQYTKSLDLWDSDPRGIHQYNEVADEFQQFQVLIQRFLEDEPLQGPRVQHYINSRCVLRNLLHVPVISEDGLKDKRKSRKREKSEYAITSDILVEILEESIRILWQFIRADKDCSGVTWKGQRESSLELQQPADLELLVEIRKTLQKKERKLKELLKSEKCILRRFKKCREDDDSDHVLYFFSQVDMKLVSRVLNMSRITTEQLVWCLNKLSTISFVNRRIQVEPSFLLFPC